MLQATDNDHTVSAQTFSTTQTVEADNSITTGTNTVTVSSSGNVTFRAGAHVTLGPGFSVASGGQFHVEIGHVIPYSTSFESSDFTTASISGQRGWILNQGSANVISPTSPDTPPSGGGSQVLELASGSTPAITSKILLPSGGTPSPTFFELYAKPVATADPDDSTIIESESISVAFAKVGGTGQVMALDGVGAFEWIPTKTSFSLNGSDQFNSWAKIDARVDYSAKTWDLFVDDKIVEYDLALGDNSETYFRQLALYGVGSASSRFDLVKVQETNPLFTDNDKDGLPDSWETAHGLSTSANSRNLDDDNDGLYNIEEYYFETSPSGISHSSSDSDGIDDDAEQLLGTSTSANNDDTSNLNELLVHSPIP